MEAHSSSQQPLESSPAPFEGRFGRFPRVLGQGSGATLPLAFVRGFAAKDSGGSRAALAAALADSVVVLRGEGAGGKDGDIINLGKRGGAEYTAECAKTDGMCK
jgi:hypothetical protein